MEKIDKLKKYLKSKKNWVKHGLNRRPMSSINITLPLDYFTTIASSCIWIFFNLNLTTRVLGRKLLLAYRMIGSLARLGHARCSRSLTGPQAGLARLLGRERWSTKIPKRSKKQRLKDSSPRRRVYKEDALPLRYMCVCG
jgi:hypothetical protein